MEVRPVWMIAQRELREGLRNKWLWLYAAGFAGLALALSWAGLASAGYSGLGGFGRTAASLINALLLFVPLIGLTVGAAALTADRERGMLLYLLAQPISRLELFAGKALGSGLAVITALALGFGLAGLGLSAAGGADARVYLTLAGYTLLLALVTLAMGFVISALARKTAAASGAALILWLMLVFLADLGLVGLTIGLRPSPETMLAGLLANPLQIFKLAAIYSLQASLDSLGPVGQFALYRFGNSLTGLLIALLIGWALLLFAAAWWIFRKRID